MINVTKMRKWVTPLTIGAFALSAVTGLMLFFHMTSGFVKVVHEWGSWLLVVGGLFHVIASWRPFVRYFSSHAGRTIMTAFALVIIASFLPLGGGSGARDRRLPPGKMSHLLLQASFETVANVALHQPEELMRELGSKGVVVGHKEETIQEIAARNDKQGVEILNMIF
jgi:hypothetical protein